MHLMVAGGETACRGEDLLEEEITFSQVVNNEGVLLHPPEGEALDRERLFLHRPLHPHRLIFSGRDFNWDQPKDETLILNHFSNK